MACSGEPTTTPPMSKITARWVIGRSGGTRSALGYRSETHGPVATRGPGREIAPPAMRSGWIPKAGPPEAVEVRDGPEPVPRAGEALIRVRASGVNFADVAARLGVYPDAPPFPCVVGYEVAGVVDRAPGADGLAPGQRVAALTRFGGYAETVAVP